MTKHAGGRPTVATPENVAKAQEYVLEGYKEEEVIPTVEGLALWLGISKESLYARDEFSDVLGVLKNKQARSLLNKGLTGDYSAVIAKLLLSSKHGYVEKNELKTENPLRVILDQYGLGEGSDAQQTDESVSSTPSGEA